MYDLNYLEYTLQKFEELIILIKIKKNTLIQIQTYILFDNSTQHTWSLSLWEGRDIFNYIYIMTMQKSQLLLHFAHIYTVKTLFKKVV